MLHDGHKFGLVKAEPFHGLIGGNAVFVIALFFVNHIGQRFILLSAKGLQQGHHSARVFHPAQTQDAV